MLAFSNLGSVDHPLARKVREATHLARARDPQLVIEGEIQLTTALNEQVRERYFPFCQLPQNANVLIFPDLQSGHLALHLLELLGDTVAVGPLLMGTRRPVHVLQYSSTVRDVVNLAALGAVYTGEPAAPVGSAEIGVIQPGVEERLH
jgi:malate dehydrogenase (oxaloacetate-decarboxylating)(NADP+)